MLKVSPHDFNERLSRKWVGTGGLAPVFPRERAKMPRANGFIGIDEKMDLAGWALKIESPGVAPRQMSLAEVKALPRVEMTTELMCVEGWNEVVHWTGTPLRNIAPPNAPEYVSLTTPDEAYVVGLDRESALHERCCWPGR